MAADLKSCYFLYFIVKEKILVGAPFGHNFVLVFEKIEICSFLFE